MCTACCGNARLHPDMKSCKYEAAGQSQGEASCSNLQDMLCSRSKAKAWCLQSQTYTCADKVRARTKGSFVHLRSATVKVACSPDDAAHLIVREPEQCYYEIVAYSPAACSVSALGFHKPQKHPVEGRDAGSDRQEL